MEDYLLIIITIIIIIGLTIFLILRSPYQYPYHYTRFDVSGKRNVNIYDYLDDYLNGGGMKAIASAQNKIILWKKQCLSEIEDSPLKKLRKKQYNKCLDDDNAFVFICTRNQTRYKQIHYQKYAYTVTSNDDSLSIDYRSLLLRNKKLMDIGFSTTLSKYESDNQRRLMTKELRNAIAKRDKYTCQMCGKYMPDGVGLHIDHIIPISKGGKSIPGNLQVLCSKCNGAKSNK